MVGLKAKLGTVFFDAPMLERRLSRKERRVLGGTGAYARRVMRNSIKKAPKRARSKSKYPRYHVSGNQGLRLILFSYDPKTGRVVIGPLKFNGSLTQDFSKWFRGRRVKTQSSKTVPQLLNEGGAATLTTEYQSGTVVRKQMRYRAMPFRDDALAPASEKLAELTRTVDL